MRRALLVLAIVVGLTACSSGDDTDPEGAADDTVAPPTTGAPASTAAPAPALTSPAFAEGAEIPVEHGGCPPGQNESSPLDWSGLPDDTAQLAITVLDPDAGGFVHWAMAGIDPATTTLAAGEVPAGAVEARNDTAQAGYFGPCPPSVHTYVFTVHALSGDPGVTAEQSGADAVAAIEAVSTATAELSGTFTP